MPPREVLPEVPTIEKFMQLVKHNIFSIKIHIYVFFSLEKILFNEIFTLTESDVDMLFVLSNILELYLQETS